MLGAWRNAFGLREVDELFTHLAETFSDCTSYAFKLRSCDVVGHLAWTAGFERTSVSVHGEPTSYALLVTGLPPRGRVVAGRPPPCGQRAVTGSSRLPPFCR